MEQFNTRKTVFAALCMAGLLFAAILTGVFVSSWGMSWTRGVALAVPLSLFAQGLAWSARYSCRSNPLGRTSLSQGFLTHITAAIVLSFLWVAVGRMIASALDSEIGWSGTFLQYTHLQSRLYVIGFAYYLLAVAFHYTLFAQENTLQAQQRALESSVRARDAELSALKAQINPHFLYNSLNSISALTSIDPARAREMCVLLADFLRLTLGLGEKTLIPLQEELDLLDRYCAIEKVRFGDRLQVEKNIQNDATLCLLPPLLLQPLFENAVVHGIAQLPEGGLIRLNATRHQDRIQLSVENSWDPEAVPARKRNGVGLKNVQRRLEARYGKEARIEVRQDEHLFLVAVNIPVELQEAQ